MKYQNTAGYFKLFMNSLSLESLLKHRSRQASCAIILPEYYLLLVICASRMRPATPVLTIPTL
jgi:hypothetical protein